MVSETADDHASAGCFLFFSFFLLRVSVHREIIQNSSFNSENIKDLFFIVLCESTSEFVEKKKNLNSAAVRVFCVQVEMR